MGQICGGRFKENRNENARKSMKHPSRSQEVEKTSVAGSILECK